MTTESRLPVRSRARLTRQGQITVPKPIRDALGARPGDEIEFLSRGAELLVKVRPKRSILDFAGLASDTATRIPATAEELDAVLEQGMTDAAIGRAARPRRSPRSR